MANNKKTQRAAKGKVRQNKSSHNKTNSQNARKKGGSFSIGEMSLPGLGNVKNINGSISLKSSVPSAYGRVDSVSGPMRSIDNEGNIVIKNREYVGDVFATLNDFVVHQELVLNPTVKNTFPWLSSISTSFQKFCFERFCVEFVTQSGTDTTGTVMLIPQYDVSTDAPSSKAEALTFIDTVRGPAWQECCSVLPRSRLCGLKDYFTEIDLDDVKMSIPAKVMVATSGATDGGPISGEIWVSYEVKLKAPQQSNNVALTYCKLFGGEYFLPGSWILKAQQIKLENTSSGFRVTFTAPGAYLITFTWHLAGAATTIWTATPVPLPNGAPAYHAFSESSSDVAAAKYGYYTVAVKVGYDPVSINFDPTAFGDLEDINYALLCAIPQAEYNGVNT